MVWFDLLNIVERLFRAFHRGEFFSSKLCHAIFPFFHSSFDILLRILNISIESTVFLTVLKAISIFNLIN